MCSKSKCFISLAIVAVVFYFLGALVQKPDFGNLSDGSASLQEVSAEPDSVLLKTPFFTSENAPQLEKILPGPPSLDSERFKDDIAQYNWGKSMRETERGQQAVIDAKYSSTVFMYRFSEAVGKELTPDNYPKLFMLLQRALLTEGQASRGAKAYFKRVRPYQQFNEPTLVPGSENPKDFTSYPSGHTHLGWLYGMIMTAVDPQNAESILNVAYELGQSRVIAGYHYQSDVDAGRLAASITLARLLAEPEFLEAYREACDEYRSINL